MSKESGGPALLPCPFCGSTVEVGVHGVKRTYYQVECDCGAIAGCAWTTQEAAAKDWNRRAPLAERSKP